MGVSVKHLSEEYGVGMMVDDLFVSLDHIRMVYELKKQKEQILQLFHKSDVSKLMDKRKT